MRLKLIAIVYLSIITATSVAKEKTDTTDTIVTRKSMFLIPYASYQPETDVAPGFTYGYYFKSKNINRISSITSNITYTFKNQFTVNLSPKIYFNSNKWYLYSNINLQNYPDYYYGIGNKPTTLKQSYTSKSYSFLLQPQYIISNRLFVGFSLSYRNEQTNTDATFENNKTQIFNSYGKNGWLPYSQTNIGLVAALDTRDSQFYPQHGFFAKTTLSSSKAGWGSNFSLQEITVDYRKYFPIFTTHTVAFQTYFAGVYGKNGIPFQQLLSIGGRDALRGFQQGKFRENSLFLVQSEYRLPVYKRLKAAIFCSAGDVFQSSNYEIYKVKIAYGAGLRYRINDARVHLRMDIAKNNYGNKLQLYLTASEAF